MVIQRLQTLFLLIAVVLMCVFCCTPWASHAAEGVAEASPVFVSEAPVLLILNIVIAVLLFISIFMFKNLKRQMTVTVLSIILICASMVTCGILLYTAYPGATFIWTGGVLLLLVALVCVLFAYRFMKKDHKLLTSYDRLR
ncbi:MAG: DUF4293 domain-containing protein [Muribaculaceae bacterium]|nr:DUF4293 domain-containing protein [Muribaculaceae bacterium]